MLENLNYIQQIELIVIIGIIIVAGYLFYSLDLYKKGK
jgi:hypothetical protein